MRNFRRSTAMLAALLATTALAAPAHAQDTEPNQRQALDENGVNPATGQYFTYMTELSIGPADDGGLHLLRSRGHGISESSLAYTITGNPSTSLNVVLGFRKIVFNNIGGNIYEPADDSGTTLVKNSSTQYTLTLEDGTVVVYKNLANDSYVARGDSVTFPNGQKLSFAYRTVEYCSSIIDPCPGYSYATRLQSVSSSLGYQFHYNYARDTDPLIPSQALGWKRIISVQAINTTIDPCDPLAVTCTTTQSWPTVAYDTTGGVTDPAGNTWRYTDSIAQFKIRRPSSAADNIIVTNDANQRTTSVVRDGMTWTYAWSLAGNLMTMTRTDPLNNVMTVVSDTTVGLPTSITNELGKVTTHQYGPGGRLFKTTFPEGNYIQLTYDGRSNVKQVKEVAKSGSGLADIITSATYPASCSNPKSCNFPTTTTDARGNVTDYSYTANGDPETVTSPAPDAMPGAIRPQVRYTYSTVSTPGGSVTKLQSVSQCQTLDTCTGTVDEAKTTVTWSNQLALTGVTRANGTGTLSAVTTITNDGVGNPKTIDGPLAGADDTTTLRFDNMRRQVGVISPDPDGGGSLKRRAVKTTYTPDGGVQSIQRGTVNGTSDLDWAAMTVLETQAIAYDEAARPATIGIAGSDGITRALTQFSYDELGRLQCTAIRMNAAIYGSLPASACDLGTDGSFGKDRIAKIVYDSASQVTQQQVAVGTSEAATEATFTYTDNGKLQTLKDAENNLTTYEYDGFDRLSKTRFPNTTQGSGTSSTTDYEQLLYDASSNVTERRLRGYASDNSQKILFTYDNLNRPTLKNLPGSEPDVTYGYDNLGRLTSAAQTGNNLSFSYDALSRNLTQAGPQGTVSSQRDLAGRRTRLTWPDSFYVDYDYLVTGEMTKVRENGATSGAGVLAILAYDDLGRRVSVTRGNGALTTYAYDPISRLQTLSDKPSSAAYDQTISFTYNPASQIVTRTGSNDSYAWTGHGNGSTASVANGLNELTSIGGTATGHDGRGNVTSDPTTGKTYAYSSENLLTASGGATLAYDPAVRLQQIGLGGATTKFAYDGLDMIAEFDGSGTMLARYVHGPGIDQQLVRYDGSGTGNKQSLHADERGSIIALSYGSPYAPTINRYDEYGKPESGNVGRFQYTGQTWIGELSAYYYKARTYSPTFGGRFLQTDPIDVAGGINLYGYVRNDPVNWADPLGLRGWCATVVYESSGSVSQCFPEPSFGGGVGGGTAGSWGGESGDICEKGRRCGPIRVIVGDRCNPIQRAGQAIGAFGVKLGGEVTQAGVAIQLVGVGVAGLSAARLNPNGVVIGGEIAMGGASVSTGGTFITAGGATLMALSGSGKPAVVQLVTNSLTSRIPSQPLRGVVRQALKPIVSAIVPELRSCR